MELSKNTKTKHKKFKTISKRQEMESGTAAPKAQEVSIDDSESYKKLSVAILEGDSESRIRQKSIFNGLLKYMLHNGSTINKFSVKFITDSNRMIYATENIKRGEIIAFIPSKVIITDDIEVIQAQAKRLSQVRDLSYEGDLPFVLWILESRRKLKFNPGSMVKFKPYFESLPEDMTNMPSLYCNTEAKNLYFSSLFLKEEYDNLFSYLDADYDILIKNNIISFDVSKEEFFEAFSLYATRDFGISNAKKEDKRALIPLIDLFNYDANKPNMALWKYDYKLKRFIIWAKNDIKEGDEILLRYGFNHTLSYFILNYGFTTENIPPSDLTLEDEDMKVVLSARRSKRNLKRAVNTIIELKYMNENESNEKTKGNIVKGNKQEKDEKSMSLEESAKAYSYLIVMMEKYLTKYTTKLRDDQRRMKNETNFDIQNILRVLIAEKKILRFYYNFAFKRLFSLSSTSLVNNQNKYF